MDVFKDQWEKQVRILTEAVDDITSVDDFLSVSGNMKTDCSVQRSNLLTACQWPDNHVYIHIHTNTLCFCETTIEYLLPVGKQKIKQLFCIHTVETL